MLDLYKEIILKLHRMRSSAHNNLIANVKALNRMCRLNNIPVIFEGNEDVRIEVAGFAKKLTDEIFSSRRK